MGATDWTALSGGAAPLAGVTAGIGVPNGGGTYVFAARSQSNTPGAWGLHTNQADFDPVAPGRGSVIRAAIRRGLQGGLSPAVGQSPFLFLGLQDADPEDPEGTSVNQSGYLLGFENADPARLILVKGRPVDGIPSAAPGSSGVLGRSVETFPLGAWLHLSFSLVVSTTSNGALVSDIADGPQFDIVLRVRRSDLTSRTVTTPDWLPVDGLDMAVDDHLGALSGSAPLSGGYAGFGAHFSAVGGIASFDHIEIERGV